MNLIDTCRHLNNVFNLANNFVLGTYVKSDELTSMVKNDCGCKVIAALAMLIAHVAFKLNIPVQKLVNIVSPIARDLENWRKDTS